eukprot:TRINITY_DN32432_c0_g1_i6.p2 TRINITY_DN32432_c0_g1~~TRINITY_DN32432_c0_g1_i6.p2  ORF type:complete len:307 (-),score=48.19 TRINITY_DN32432_c0_g1_i6:80-1000(-)
MRDFVLMASDWAPHKGPKMQKEKWMDWAARWIFDPAMEVNLTDKFWLRKNSLKGRLDAGDGICSEILAPFAAYCFTCCRTGVGRIKVAFVRNPYTRLVSAYRGQHVNRGGVRGRMTPFMAEHNLSVAEDFSHYLAFLASVDYALVEKTSDHSMLAKQPLRFISFTHRGEWAWTSKMQTALRFVQIHAQPISEELAAAKEDWEDYHIVRLEHSREDLVGLEQRLCEELAFCHGPLPAFPQANTWLHAQNRRKVKRKSVGAATARKVLTREAVLDALINNQALLQKRYGRDFAVAGYPTDPRVAKFNV